MIEIELHDRLGAPYVVDPHPEFVDFELRDSYATLAYSRVGIHPENFCAPIVAKLHAQAALQTYPELSKALAHVLASFAHRQDALRTIELLLAWVKRWPDGRWSIAGAERLTQTGFLERSSVPRFSARSLAVDPFESEYADLWVRDWPPGVAGRFWRTMAVVGTLFGFDCETQKVSTFRGIGDAERMADMDGINLEALDEREDISGPALLQREVRIQGRSHSSSGRIRDDKRKGGGGVRVEQLPISGKRDAVVSVRVTTEEKTALDSDAEGKRRMFEAVAAAIASGRSYDDVIAGIERSE